MGLRSQWFLAVLLVAGCAEDTDKPVEGDAELDVGRNIDIDMDVPDPDEGVEADTGGTDPDDGVDPDGAVVVPDMSPPDAFVPPPDMFVGASIETCEDACGRYTQCDRLADIFGDEDNCMASCERVSRAGRPDDWFDCLEIEACNLMHRCPRPDVEPLECPELCELAEGCEVPLPFDDCEGRCADGGDAFRACGEHLFGQCGNQAFVGCLGNDVFPQCEEMCGRAVPCNILLGETCVAECIGSLFDADALARMRAEQRHACVRRQNEGACVEIDQCIFPVDPVDPPPVNIKCGALCAAQDVCGLLEEERAACNLACANGFDQGNDIAERLAGALDCGEANRCDELQMCLDAASPRAECQVHCGLLDGCGLAAEDCVDACDVVWPRDRQEAYRTCVADAADCDAMAECEVARPGPCPEACVRLNECGLTDDADLCAAGCDDAHFAAPVAEAQRLACFLAAPVCANAGDPGAFTVEGCIQNPAGGEACLGFCRALSEECSEDPEAELAACMGDCGAGLAGDLGLRFAAAEPCLAALEVDAECAAVAACVPGEVNLDCDAYCASAVGCDVPRADCLANCADDPLSRLRVLEASRCLPDAGEVCDDVRECIDPPQRPVDGGPAVDFDAVAFCQIWDGCFIFEPPDCPGVLAELQLSGGLAAQGCALDVLRAEGCQERAALVARCGGGGAAHPIAAECERLCRAQAFCSDEELDQAACQSDCRGELARRDPDSAARLAPRLLCSASWSCGDLETCIDGSEPGAVCERHCLALDGCGVMPEGCVETCDDGFARDRQFTWRDCVRRAGDDCDAVAACAPPPLLPCDRYCAQLGECGVGDDRCEPECDDRHFAEPLPTALEVSCVLAARDCADPEVLSVQACLDDPEAGGTACLGYCRAITECDPENDGDVVECVNRCVNGFGDADGLRFAASAGCLEGLAVDAQCAPLGACLADELPIDCEAHCGRLDGCQIPAEGCVAGCDAAPDADSQGCVLDALRVGAGCEGVAECVDYEPPAADILCTQFCDVRSGCDRALDPYLCRLECTPTPEELGVQLGCALVSECGDIGDCLELGAELNEDCAEPCADAAVCRVYANEALCNQACTGQAAAPRAREDYVASLGVCIDGVIADEVCDRGEAAECFNPSLCEGTDDVMQIPANGGRFMIDNAALPNAYQGGCGGRGPEQVVSITTRVRAQVTFETVNNEYDTLIWLRSECDDAAAEIACDDDGGNGLASRISAPLEAGTYFLFVDGFGAAGGTTDLVVTVQPL